jgi:hypothetical protein
MEYTVYHLYNTAFRYQCVYAYKGTDLMTYPFLSQLTKFTLSDFAIQSL